MAAVLSDAVVSAVQTIYVSQNEPIDLNRIEIMSIPRKLGSESKFVNGLVMDHGARHPDMPSVLNNCKIMTCNVSLEYEKTETQSGFYYSTAEEREALVESERKWLDERCRQVVDFKRRVCKEGEVRPRKIGRLANIRMEHSVSTTSSLLFVIVCVASLSISHLLLLTKRVLIHCPWTCLLRKEFFA